MKTLALKICLLALLITPAAQAQDRAVLFEAESDSYSDSFAIGGYISDIEGASFEPGGTDAYTHNQIFLGVAYSPDWAVSRGLEFSAGLTSRYDYAINYSSDLAQFLYQTENSLDLDDGAYDIDLNLSHISGTGIWARADYQLPKDISIWARASILRARDFFDGNLSGQGNVTNSDIDELSLDLDYFFSEDLIFTNDIDVDKSTGFTLDIGAKWAFNDALSVSLDIDDIYSAFDWDNAPRTQANATTDTVSENEDGTLNVRATLEGVNSNQDFTQSLEVRSEAQINYQVSDDWELSQNLFNLDGIWLTRSAIRHELRPELFIGAHAEWVTGALGLSVDWKAFRVLLISDAFDIDEARYIKANIGAKFKF